MPDRINAAFDQFTDKPVFSADASATPPNYSTIAMDEITELRVEVVAFAQVDRRSPIKQLIKEAKGHR